MNLVNCMMQRTLMLSMMLMTSMLVASCDSETDDPECEPQSDCDLCNLKDICNFGSSCSESWSCEGEEVTVCGYIEYVNTCDPGGLGHGQCHNGEKFFFHRQTEEQEAEDELEGGPSFVEVQVRADDTFPIFERVWENYGLGDDYSGEVSITATIESFEMAGNGWCDNWFVLVLTSAEDIAWSE